MLIDVHELVDVSCWRPQPGTTSLAGNAVAEAQPQSYPLAGDLGSLNPAFPPELWPPAEPKHSPDKVYERGK
jgi:hypothetical protein